MSQSPKHLELIVPNYDQSGSVPGSPLTYFRMGADFQGDDPDPPEAARGNELLAGMQFKDDHRAPTRPGKTYVKETGAELVSGGVDYRSDLTAEVLALESQGATHTRGGWRDHTDGNRISTTRGDCVEVVRGNYKLVVLGRVADHWESANNPNVGRSWLESSGGHNHASTSTPGEVQTISWTENEDGTWRVKEQTDKGNVLSFVIGRSEEHYFGPSIISTVGCGAPGVPEKRPIRGDGAADPHAPQLPDIESETYACSITNVDTVDLHTSTTVADTIVDKTHISTSKTSVETSADLHESTTYVGALDESLLADVITETNDFGLRRFNTLGGVEVGLSFVGFHHHRRASTALDFTLAGATIDLSVAASASLSIGAFTSAEIGVKNGFGATLVKLGFTLVKLEAALVKNEIFLMRDGLTASEIAPRVTEQRLFLSEIVN